MLECIFCGAAGNVQEMSRKYFFEEGTRVSFPQKNLIEFIQQEICFHLTLKRLTNKQCNWLDWEYHP